MTTDPHPGNARSSAPQRATWLVLAEDGPAAELPAHALSTTVRVVRDARRFCGALLAERPRIAVCVQPPADRETIELVAIERRRRSNLLVVHLSPTAAVADRLAALVLGFDDALPTSMPAAELAWRLGRLETRADQRAAVTSVLDIGDGLELDLDRHELRRDGQPVHLRPKEFGLLAELASHPGRSYSRRELLAMVWGTAHQGGARTVDVHVRWLRSKVEPDPDHPVHLVTVRGIGYRFDASAR